jgi:hypothetical protein
VLSGTLLIFCLDQVEYSVVCPALEKQINPSAHCIDQERFAPELFEGPVW